MKIAFIYGGPGKLSANLTEAFTGSRCYHVAFVDEARGCMFDMHLIRRVRDWPHYDPARVVLAPAPVEVSFDFLFGKLKSDENTYGWRDYALFAARPVFHALGRSTPNAGGIICSEMVANDLIECGWDKHFNEVPSPADLEKVILGGKAK